jgi:hypothetical protein
VDLYGLAGAPQLPTGAAAKRARLKPLPDFGLGAMEHSGSHDSGELAALGLGLGSQPQQTQAQADRAASWLPSGSQALGGSQGTLGASRFGRQGSDGGPGGMQAGGRGAGGGGGNGEGGGGVSRLLQRPPSGTVAVAAALAAARVPQQDMRMLDPDSAAPAAARADWPTSAPAAIGRALTTVAGVVAGADRAADMMRTISQPLPTLEPPVGALASIMGELFDDEDIPGAAWRPSEAAAGATGSAAVSGLGQGRSAAGAVVSEATGTSVKAPPPAEATGLAGNAGEGSGEATGGGALTPQRSAVKGGLDADSPRASLGVSPVSGTTSDATQGAARARDPAFVGVSIRTGARGYARGRGARR